MALAVQTSALPTNKLAVGALLASLAATKAGPLTAEIWPQLAPAFLAGPVATDVAQVLVGALAGVAVGWFVKDRPNLAQP